MLSWISAVVAIGAASIASATAAAGGADPTAAAMDFVEKVRSGSLNLEPNTDTALTPHTSTGKRREIGRRLERLGADLGKDPLESGSARVDGELAGVLVRQTSALDPTRLRVLAIGLVRRGDVWLPAPLPGSFENSGIRHAPGLRERVDALESWMLSAQAQELGRLREKSAARVRERIEASLPAAALRGMDSRAACERFLEACARRDVASMLGLLGGLSADLPADWELRLKATREAMERRELARPWRLLGDPDVLRVIAFHDADQQDAMVSIACLDPSGKGGRLPAPRLEFVYLELSKTMDGLWRINPPAYFFEPASAQDEEADEDGDSELPEDFPVKLRAAYPATPQESAREIQRLTLAALQHGTYPSLVPLMHLDSAVSACTASLIRAAQDSRTPGDPAVPRILIPHGSRETGTAAAAVWQFFSPKRPERLELRTLLFRKTADGWLWTPLATTEERGLFSDWLDLEEQRVRSEWRPSLLAESHELTAIPEAAAPGEDDARSVVSRWLDTTADGELPTATRLSARLKLPDSDELLLRNLGYEMTSNARASEKPRIIGVRRGSVWTLVAARSVIDGKESFPLYPVLQTPAGPRILLEIDLFAGGGRSRDFLNKTSLNRLRGLSAPAARELQDLLAMPQDLRAAP